MSCFRNVWQAASQQHFLESTGTVFGLGWTEEVCTHLTYIWLWYFSCLYLIHIMFFLLAWMELLHLWTLRTAPWWTSPSITWHRTLNGIPLDDMLWPLSPGGVTRWFVIIVFLQGFEFQVCKSYLNLHCDPFRWTTPSGCGRSRVGCCRRTTKTVSANCCGGPAHPLSWPTSK